MSRGELVAKAKAIEAEGLTSRAHTKAQDQAKVQKEQERKFISTGSTLLNLACSDSAWGGFKTGKIVNLVGDSSAGKSILALTCLAEVAINPALADYRLIYDDAETALEFDLSKLFPTLPGCLDIIPPSKTIQKFQISIAKAVKIGQPFIYILDSLDAVTTDEELTKLNEIMKAKTEAEAEAIAKGYRLEKPKMMSELLRKINDEVARLDSLLIIISQTRDNITATPFTPKKTRSGGRALEFYSSHTIWLSVRKTIKEKYLQLGAETKAKVTKNKIDGKKREVFLTIYDFYGIDDIGSCVDYLIENGHWIKTAGGRLVAKDFEFEGRRKDLITKIEQEDLTESLKAVTQEVWLSIEKSVIPDRKPRFSREDKQ